MLREVQSIFLFFVRHSQANESVNDFEEDECHSEGTETDGERSKGLDPEESHVESVFVENCYGQGPPNSAEQVNRNGAYDVIQMNFLEK